VSADNYNLIRHGLDGRFRVWLNLSDSCNQEQQVRDAKPNAEFDDYEVALEWTEKNIGYTEYGTQTDEEREPGKCICEARMAGECACGAWDEPLPTRANDPEKAALLARVRELEEALGICLNVYEDVCNDLEKSKERRDALRSLLARAT